MNDQYRDADATDFDIYYYNKIANSGDSLTKAEQQKLASVLSSTSAASANFTQSSNCSTNSFSSTNTSILTEIVQSLWHLFQAVTNTQSLEYNAPQKINAI